MTDIAKPNHFIQEHRRRATTEPGGWGGRVHTRFPPEPNGYLHIGHAKSICLNFGLARAYGGKFNLRFDDTNPAKEEQEYVDSIISDVKWLGGGLRGPAVLRLRLLRQHVRAGPMRLIKGARPTSANSSADEVARAPRQPHRARPAQPLPRPPREENLDLFRRMRDGEFPNGSKTLRAKIDMASANFNLRDPVMYRIVHAAITTAPATPWCIYPMYDWAHGTRTRSRGSPTRSARSSSRTTAPSTTGSSQAAAELPPTADRVRRLNLTYTVLSKRKLLQLVQDGHVRGWDDPRMPTLSRPAPARLHARSHPPRSARSIGVTQGGKRHRRRPLRERRPRGPERPARGAWRCSARSRSSSRTTRKAGSKSSTRSTTPKNPAAGTRKVPFSRELYIERDDFMEDPPKKFFRLAPGREVRLRSAYFITCKEVVKDASGQITELRCTYDPATRGGDSPDGRKVKATLHWVSAKHAVPAEVRLFDRLFSVEEPEGANGRLPERT